MRWGGGSPLLQQAGIIPWAGGSAGPQQSTGTHGTSNQEGLSVSEFQGLAAEPREGAESVWEATASCPSTQAEPSVSVSSRGGTVLSESKGSYGCGESSQRQVLGTGISTSGNYTSSSLRIIGDKYFQGEALAGFPVWRRTPRYKTMTGRLQGASDVTSHPPAAWARLSPRGCLCPFGFTVFRGS